MKKSRITIVETVTHQTLGEAAGQPCETRFARWLDSDGQPCAKRSIAGPDWSPLDCGWVAEAGMVVVTNDGRGQRAVQPTTEERTGDEAAVLGMGVKVGEGQVWAFASVRPGESARFEPIQQERLVVCCWSGTCRYTVSAFPR